MVGNHLIDFSDGVSDAQKMRARQAIHAFLQTKEARLKMIKDSSTKNLSEIADAMQNQTKKYCQRL